MSADLLAAQIAICSCCCSLLGPPCNFLQMPLIPKRCHLQSPLSNEWCVNAPQVGVEQAGGIQSHMKS